MKGRAPEAVGPLMPVGSLRPGQPSGALGSGLVTPSYSVLNCWRQSSLRVTVGGGPVLPPPVHLARSPPLSQSRPRGVQLRHPWSQNQCKGRGQPAEGSSWLSLWTPPCWWALTGTPSPYLDTASRSFRKALSKDISRERRVRVWRLSLEKWGGAGAIPGRFTASFSCTPFLILERAKNLVPNASVDLAEPRPHVEQGSPWKVPCFLNGI